MKIDRTYRTELFLEDDFIISNHVRVRMFQRNISTGDIGQVILYGEIIEEYTDDEPGPSALFLGYVGETPYHAVLALCKGFGGDYLKRLGGYRFWGSLKDGLYFTPPQNELFKAALKIAVYAGAVVY